MQSKYSPLLDDRDIRRWHQNVARGSQITADVYLRRMGGFCDSNKVTPRGLLKLSDKRLYDLFLDTVSAMEKDHAGSYVVSVLKAVKSWLAFSDRFIRRSVKVRGADQTPTLADERVPTPDELKQVLFCGDPRARVICVLLAHSGLRPEVLGNYEGTDGLRVGDLPELEVAGEDVRFKRAPAIVKVRSSLSKKRHEYITFLGEEGCEYIKAYLGIRLKKGERLTPNSPIVTPMAADKPFIKTGNIGDAARKVIRKAGFPWRPYVLRSYFATQMMLAESKGLVIRDYRTFFMGHKGDIEAVYTVNKRKLPPDVVEQMRESYAKAQKYLQTIETSGHEDVTKAFKRQLLLVAGFKADEIKDEHLELEDEQFQRVVRDRLITEVKNNGARQKVVALGKVEGHLAEGWEFVGALPNNKAIVKLPKLD